MNEFIFVDFIINFIYEYYLFTTIYKCTFK